LSASSFSRSGRLALAQPALASAKSSRCWPMPLRSCCRAGQLAVHALDVRGELGLAVRQVAARRADDGGRHAQAAAISMARLRPGDP
jgi:hypothetical protein